MRSGNAVVSLEGLELPIWADLLVSASQVQSFAACVLLVEFRYVNLPQSGQCLVVLPPVDGKDIRLLMTMPLFAMLGLDPPYLRSLLPQQIYLLLLEHTNLYNQASNQLSTFGPQVCYACALQSKYLLSAQTLMYLDNSPCICFSNLFILPFRHPTKFISDSNPDQCTGVQADHQSQSLKQHHPTRRLRFLLGHPRAPWRLLRGEEQVPFWLQPCVSCKTIGNQVIHIG
jgi:hypothetical protein